jgi:hypothetical protein
MFAQPFAGITTEVFDTPSAQRVVIPPLVIVML